MQASVTCKFLDDGCAGLCGRDNQRRPNARFEVQAFKLLRVTTRWGHYMFYTLLAVTFVISLIVSATVVSIFDKPARRIFQRIIQDDIAAAWTTYLKFALYVVGVSRGIRLHHIEQYIIRPQCGNDSQLESLTTEKWFLELFRTIIETLQALAWVLLTFFIISLFAFVIIRLIEVFKKNSEAR